MRYFFLMLFSKFIRLLPHTALLFLGKILGILYYYFIKKQRNRAIYQMQNALQIDIDEAKKLVKKSFINLGQNVLEILYMPNLNTKNFRNYIEIENLSTLQNELKKGKGVIILTGHIGTWEWLSAAFTLSGLPVTAIAKPQPNETYTRFLNDLRKTIDVEIFSRGTSEILAAARALKQGKILGFLADQDAGPAGAFIDFLGKKASTPMGPAVFSRKFNAPVIPAFILRKQDGKHKVVIGKAMRIEDFKTDDKDEVLYLFTKKMTNILERVILENPTQWLWFQKRWNTKVAEQKQRSHILGTDKIALGKKHE